jgi:hypothetical protein
MWVSFWKGWAYSMKKILLVVLCVALAVSFVGCGGSAEPEETVAQEDYTSDIIGTWKYTNGFLSTASVDVDMWKQHRIEFMENGEAYYYFLDPAVMDVNDIDKGEAFEYTVSDDGIVQWDRGSGPQEYKIESEKLYALDDDGIKLAAFMEKI